MIHDEFLFARLENDIDQALALDDGTVQHIVRRSCEIKAEVVRQDERESGLRAILNYGHTLGHAVEKVTGYERFLHGEAIGVGMAFAAVLSHLRLDLPKADVARQLDLLAATGLPTMAPDLDIGALIDAMRVDKKSIDSVPRFVLADRIGHVEFGVDVPTGLLTRAWELQHAT